MNLRSRKLWLTLAALPLLAAVTFWWLREEPLSALDDYKRQLIAQGEKLDYRQLIPASLPVEEDGTAIASAAFSVMDGIWKRASDQISASAMKMVAPGRAAIGWQQAAAFDYDQKTNSWEAFATEQVTNEPVVLLLRDLLAKPRLDFHPEYGKGFDMLLPFLAKYKAAAQLLQRRTILDLHEHRTGEAVTNLLTMLVFVNGTAEEHIIISQLVRIAIVNIAMSITWEILQAPDLTETQLAAMQESWARIELVTAMERSFEMERALGATALAKLRASNRDVKLLTGAFGSSSGAGSSGTGDWWSTAKEKFNEGANEGKIFIWRNYWSYDDELKKMHAECVLIETCRAIRTNLAFTAAMSNEATRLNALGILRPTSSWVFSVDGQDIRTLMASSVQALSSANTRVFISEAAKRLTLTAIALKHFQLAHGKLPASLAELSPAPPADPADGQPLRYRLNADGSFLLYSIGENGTDDGGSPGAVSAAATSFSWQRGRDWVWPQPATEAEIQFFRATKR